MPIVDPSIFGAAPDWSAHVAYFETEMGSKYCLTSSNMSRRLKFGTDLHDWYSKCIFVPNYNILGNFDTALRGMFLNREPVFLRKRRNQLGIFGIRNNELIQVTNLSQTSNHSGIVEPLEFTMTPTLGYNVFEVYFRQDGSLKKFHPGHCVTSIEIAK